MYAHNTSNTPQLSSWMETANNLEEYAELLAVTMIAIRVTAGNGYWLCDPPTGVQ